MGGSGGTMGGSGGSSPKVCEGDRTITSQADYQHLIDEQCSEITGSLSIQGGRDLTDISGLASLRKVGESVTISDNLALSSLDGLGGLTTINGALLLRGPFTSLMGLHVTSVRDGFSLEDSALTSLAGLEQLNTVGGLTLSGNLQLASLEALANLGSVGSGLELHENAVLPALTGLESLTRVDTLNIVSNAELGSLGALLGWPGRTVGAMTISNNPRLPQCQVEAFDVAQLGASCTGCALNDAAATCR